MNLRDRLIVVINLLLLCVDLSCVDSSPRPEVTHHGCKKDGECKEGEFCETMNSWHNCVPCLDCQKINRTKRKNCAKKSSDCGTCLPGFGEEGTDCVPLPWLDPEDKIDNGTTKTTTDPNCNCNNDLEGKPDQPRDSSFWIKGFWLLIAAVAVLLCLLAYSTYIRMRGAQGATQEHPSSTSMSRTGGLESSKSNGTVDGQPLDGLKHNFKDALKKVIRIQEPEQNPQGQIPYDIKLNEDYNGFDNHGNANAINNKSPPGDTESENIHNARQYAPEEYDDILVDGHARMDATEGQQEDQTVPGSPPADNLTSNISWPTGSRPAGYKVLATRLTTIFCLKLNCRIKVA